MRLLPERTGRRRGATVGHGPCATRISKGGANGTHSRVRLHRLGAHFDDSQSLDRHNREKHLKNAAGMEVPRHPNVEGSGPLERGADEEGPRG